MTAVSAVLDVLLAGGAVLAAGGALFLPRRTTAVMMFLVFGLLLALIWARLGAPDVALAEAAIGAGVTGALLLDAAVAPRPHRHDEATRGGVVVWAAGGLAAVAIAAVVLSVAPVGDRAAGGDVLGDLATGRLDESGLSHPVTAVLLNFRSYDTLLEMVVLLIAVLASLSLRQSPELRSTTRPEHSTAAFDALVRVLAPVLVLIAGWVLVAGSTRPGGAFQSGAVLAGALILLHLNGMSTLPTSLWLRPGVLVGLGAFLALAYGSALGTGWLDLDAAWAGEVVLVLETCLALTIGVTLAALFLAAQPDDGEHR